MHSYLVDLYKHVFIGYRYKYKECVHEDSFARLSGGALQKLKNMVNGASSHLSQLGEKKEAD
jgi:hypothetical protein